MDTDYVAARNALMPEAEHLAYQDVETKFGIKSKNAETEDYWCRRFHLWMDRLCYERIYHREWPR